MLKFKFHQSTLGLAVVEKRLNRIACFRPLAKEGLGLASLLESVAVHWKSKDGSTLE